MSKKPLLPSHLTRLPDDEPEPVVTGLMRRTVSRTLTAVRTCGLCVWSGGSRLGKTTTGTLLVRDLERAYDPDDASTFRGLHYEVGEVRAVALNAQKAGIHGLHYQLLKTPIPDGEYRRLPPEALAERVVRTLMRKGIRVVLVDEAGNLSLEAIRGLVLVRDVAEKSGWRLSLVFIGMDDLPDKLVKIEQIKHRVHAWCFFEEYSVAETRKLLAELHPHFRSAAQGGTTPEADLDAEVAYIHNEVGGYPGRIVPLLEQFNARVETAGRDISLAGLMAVCEMMRRDRDRMMDESRHGFRRRPEPDEQQSQHKAKPRRTRRSESKPASPEKPAEAPGPPSAHTDAGASGGSSTEGQKPDDDIPNPDLRASA